MFATNMWDYDAPGHLNQRKSPSILDDDDELPNLNMPDITVEEDLQGLEEEIENIRQPSPAILTPPAHGEMPAEPGRVRATVEDAEEAAVGDSDAYYIEKFPENLGAGAVWGEELPFFEVLRREQESNGSSCWGPFENKEEWELGKWLIRNIGQNQINSFLNLNIVKSYPL
jgi:hypothetical protein